MDLHLHIAGLITKKIKGEISSEEETDLQNWLNENQVNADLYNRILGNQHLLNKLEVYQLFDKERIWSALENKLFETKIIKLTAWKDAHRFLRYAASILLPVIMFTGLAYYFNVFQQDSLANINEVIKPGEQKATLILSDGVVLDLQSENAKKEIKQGKAQITNQNNTLTYTAVEEVVAEKVAEIQPLIYNELVTPRGGGYKLTLADGTEVWLNAASTLKFPVSFTDSTRQVFLEGEAFFDVSHNGKPFIVSANNMDIRVLGTSFNVSAYPEEPSSKTTLVEGSIKLTVSDIEKILSPDEQAVISKDNFDVTIHTVNTELYTSWINGKIEFNQEDLDGVMRRLARWYDFEYSFENEQARNFHFTARIENTERISSILEMLELTTKVKSTDRL